MIGSCCLITWQYYKKNFKENMTTKNFRKVLLNLMFLLGFYAQAQVYVSQWVTPPEDKDLEKPLVYVDFWATWCAPCVSSMPHTLGLEQRFGDRMLFLYISTEPAYKIKEFLKRKGYRMYMASEPQRKNLQKYHVRFIPAAFILGPNGKIVWKGRPSQLTQRKIKQLLEKYGNQKGDPRRIIQLDSTGQTPLDYYKKSTYRGHVIHYIIFPDPVPEQTISKDGKNYYQGSLKYIFSKIYGVDPSVIDAPELYGKIILPDMPGADKKEALLHLLTIHHYKVMPAEKEVGLYVLKDNGTGPWLNNQLYQYAEKPGEMTFMSDDTSLIIDNATPAQMAQVLSSQTGVDFRYHGAITERYDWNLPLGDMNALLDYLKKDLNMDVKWTREKQKIYFIYEDNN